MYNSVKLAVSLLVLGGGLAQAATELVTNGGFETGNFFGWNVFNASSGSWVDQNGIPHSGSVGAEFGATSGLPDTLQQSIPTTAGLTYHVEFWLNVNGGGEGPGGPELNIEGAVNSFQASFGGTTILDLVDASASPYGLYSGNILATSSSTLLSFSSFNGPSFFFLDDVSVTELQSEVAVPEASTTAAFVAMAGFVGFAMWRRGRA